MMDIMKNKGLRYVMKLSMELKRLWIIADRNPATIRQGIIIRILFMFRLRKNFRIIFLLFFLHVFICDYCFLVMVFYCLSSCLKTLLRYFQSALDLVFFGFNLIRVISSRCLHISLRAVMSRYSNPLLRTCLMQSRRRSLAFLSSSSTSKTRYE